MLPSPVCDAWLFAFLACRLIKLPPWVRVVLTGRPQVEPYFAHCEPEWIRPEEKQNRADLRELLRARLHRRGCVAEGDLNAAADLLLEKSEVGLGPEGQKAKASVSSQVLGRGCVDAGKWYRLRALGSIRYCPFTCTALPPPPTAGPVHLLQVRL